MAEILDYLATSVSAVLVNPPPDRYHFFDDADLKCLEELVAIAKPGRSLESARRELHERVFLDTSLQGWTPESLREAAEKDELEISRDLEADFPDPVVSGSSPGFDHLSSRRCILLGYYCPEPRHIVLFPSAIRLVAEVKGIAGNVLKRVVLVHELAHWFTLGNGEQRLGYRSDGGSAFWEREHLKPSEYAETLAELVSWLVFNGGGVKNAMEAEAHRKCQYRLNDPAPHYAYQLYRFWLVASGMATTMDDLKGEGQAGGGRLACSGASLAPLDCFPAVRGRGVDR